MLELVVELDLLESCFLFEVFFDGFDVLFVGTLDLVETVVKL